MSVVELLMRDFGTVAALRELAEEAGDFPCSYTCEATGRLWVGRGTLRADRRTIDLVTADGERFVIDLGRDVAPGRAAT